MVVVHEHVDTTEEREAGEPIARDEIEAFLKTKIEADEAETGLYDTGEWFVVVDRVDDEFTFQWFDSPIHLDDVL
ncbi:hypothetical protein UNDKW_5951 (plasmid) [Undibacterium sp. KW1]|uniref:hypothetical protein n=1 Tax=Undibacterium sp. KW1 TaxID=2058624 RepID=UPI001331F62F|nr:hypothetical protein [Undibacterium sp. KW1]BBB64224.1 hypothetical protein UNDKW_5951 [Undibacterium sp. KW1]